MAIESFGEIAERLRRSTVQVAGGRRSQGSGFIAKSDGVIVTNAHVATDSKLSVQLWDGTSYPATPQGTEPPARPGDAADSCGGSRCGHAGEFG